MTSTAIAISLLLPASALAVPRHGSACADSASGSARRASANAGTTARPGRASSSHRGSLDRPAARTSMIVRIAVTNPAVADAAVVQSREILVDGKAAGHDQPDRLERHRPQALRPRRRAGDHDTAAAAAHALPRRRHRGQRDRRSDHPLRRSLEQRRVAARRGNRAGQFVEGQSHQHAAAPERAGEPAGDAAGALRRGQSPRADRARSQLRRQSTRLSRAFDDAAVRRADHRRSDGRRQAWSSAIFSTCSSSTARKAGARSSRRCSRRASSRASPSRT